MQLRPADVAWDSASSGGVEMATFVLVHGAMHGGWCWRHVHHELTRRGHDVHRPTLTGQGDRSTGLAPEVGVSTHVQDLEDLLWFEDLARGPPGAPQLRRRPGRTPGRACR